MAAKAGFTVAAIMHYKEAEIMFEVMDVDVQINGSDCGLHAVATAYKLCAGNDPTGITWEHDQLRSHLQRDKQSSHFRGKVRDLVALFGLHFKSPFLHLPYARRTVNEHG